jgi:hypothetical protein
LFSSFDEGYEELEGANTQTIVPSVILPYLRQPDETAFSRLRNSKRGLTPTGLEVIVGCPRSISLQATPSSEISTTHDCRERELIV